MKDWIRRLRPVDVLTIAYLVLLSLVAVVFATRIHSWPILLLINIGGGCGVVFLARGAQTMGNRLLHSLHDWYPVPTIFLLFKEVHVLIQSLDRTDWDELLIMIDRAIFGTDPTVWLSRYAVPWLTEILQIAYVSYYFIMLTVGIELYLRKDMRKFSLVLFIILYGFCLSYIGYLAFPAVGPRFTLHDFNLLNTELPGLYITKSLREFLDAGESIPRGVANAVALAQRDAFPSGHTQMTLISLYLAHQFKLRSRFILYVAGVLLIVSTVYLRYHYVVDIVGGVLFMWLTIATASRLFEWWERFSHPDMSC